MAVYRQVFDSRHLQADCQELGSAPEPYARQSSMGYLYLFSTALGATTALAHYLLDLRDVSTITPKCLPSSTTEHVSASGAVNVCKQSFNLQKF